LTAQYASVLERDGLAGIAQPAVRHIPTACRRELTKRPQRAPFRPRIKHPFTTRFDHRAQATQGGCGPGNPDDALKTERLGLDPQNMESAA
jgi:hypothetical protein